MEKHQKTLLKTLLFTLGIFVALVFGTHRPKPSDDSQSAWAISQGFKLEMKWVLEADMADFATVQDTLAFYSSQIAALEIPINWRLDHCCGDQTLQAALTNGPSAYQLSLEMAFPSDEGRFATLAYMYDKGFLTAKMKRLNFWEAEGIASLSLPIPGQPNRLLEIEGSAIHVTAAPQVAQHFPLS